MASLIEYPGGFLIADAVDDSSIDDTATMTDHPVESGSVISDHIIHDPTVVAVTLFATQTPIYSDANFVRQQRTLGLRVLERSRQTSQITYPPRRNPQLNVASAISRALEQNRPSSFEGVKVGPVKESSFDVTVLAANDPVDRVNAFYDRLLEIKNTHALCTLTFKGHARPNMVLLSVRKSDTPAQVGASSFACRFRQFTTVATQQTTLPAVPAARKKQGRGAKGLENEETDETRKQSLLSRIVGSVTGAE